MQWYYSRRGTQQGPVTEEQLKGLIRSGELSPEDLVWNPEMGDQWASLSSIPSLNSLQGATPPPMAVSAFSDGTTPNRELMSRARASLKGNWGQAILAVLIVGTLYQLPNLFRFLIDPAMFTGHPTGKTASVTPAFFWNWRTSAGLFVAFASLLFTGPLVIGANRFFIHLARRTNPSISDLFVGFRSGRSYYWRTVGLIFLIALMIAGWALVAFLPVGAFLAALIWMTKSHPEFRFGFFLAPILYCAVIVFLLVKIYSYKMACYVLADEPSVTAREAVRRSVRMMKGRIWKFVCLGFRFLGWALLALLTCGIGLLWVGTYAATSTALFYDDVKGNLEGQADISGSGV